MNRTVRSRTRAASSRRARTTMQRARPPSPLRVWGVSLSTAMLCLVVASTLLALTPPGQQLLETLRFMLGWQHIAQRQQQLTHVLEQAIQQAGLPSTAHQQETAMPQHRGRELWRQQRHSIRVPMTHSITALEAALETAARRVQGVLLERRGYDRSSEVVVDLILGTAGVPTHALRLTQSRPVAISSPSHQQAAITSPVRSQPALTAAVFSETVRVPSPRQPALSPPTGSPQVAIVIDDVGWDLDVAQALLALDAPLSFAILPEAPYRALIAQEAQRRGQDILLHLPMESHGAAHIDLGPYALRHRMSDDELAHQIDAAIATLPMAVGINNHMGSRLTENRAAMRAVMQQIKRHHLFFLDSRTSQHSLAYQVAQEMGVPAARRQIFLDNDVEPHKIAQQLQRLSDLALKRGSAIGIGHPHAATLHVLQQQLPALRQAGIDVVPISRLMR